MIAAPKNGQPVSARHILACLILVLVEVAAAGCGPTLENFSYVAPERYPPKPDTAFIEVHHASPNLTDIRDLDIPRSYNVIATFVVEEGLISSALTEKARKKARQLGGDAIIVQPIANRELSDIEFSRVQVWVIRFRESSEGVQPNVR